MSLSHTVTPSPSNQLMVGSVLSRSFRMMITRFGTYVGLCCMLFFPPLVLMLLFYDLPMLRNLGVFVFIGSFAAMKGAFAFIVFQRLCGRKPRLSESIFRGTRRFFPILLASAIILVCQYLGLMLLIIPGLVVVCMWSVTIPVCSVEQTGTFSSLARSAKLTKGSRWQILILILIAEISPLLLSYLGVFLLDPSTPYPLIIAFVIAFLFMPNVFYAVMVTIIYYDLRILKEDLPATDLSTVFD